MSDLITSLPPSKKLISFRVRCFSPIVFSQLQIRMGFPCSCALWSWEQVDNWNWDWLKEMADSQSVRNPFYNLTIHPPENQYFIYGMLDPFADKLHQQRHIVIINHYLCTGWFGCISSSDKKWNEITERCQRGDSVVEGGSLQIRI